MWKRNYWKEVSGYKESLQRSETKAIIVPKWWLDNKGVAAKAEAGRWTFSAEAEALKLYRFLLDQDRAPASTFLVSNLNNQK